MPVKSGYMANASGKILEESMIPVLRGLGFEIAGNREYQDYLRRGALPSRLAVQNMPYTTIYGTKGKTEFCLIADSAAPTAEFPKPGRPFRCRVECKWQASSGSVDEKFPYLVLSAEQAYPEEHVILLLEIEKGARPGAVQWLHNAVAERTFQTSPEKLIVVNNLSGFLDWARRAFPWAE